MIFRFMRAVTELDPYLDDDGDIIEDIVIHCTQEHFKKLMQVDQ